MQVWLFRGDGDLRALCADDGGAVLPIEHGPWVLLRGIELDQGGDDEADAKRLVAEHGFCCFRNSDD
jgi:hypothetical protein